MNKKEQIKNDQEVLEYIQSRLCVDWEDIRKGFDKLLEQEDYLIGRVDKLERRLIKYEKVRISQADEKDILAAGGFEEWWHAEDDASALNAEDD